MEQGCEARRETVGPANGATSLVATQAYGLEPPTCLTCSTETAYDYLARVGRLCCRAMVVGQGHPWSLHWRARMGRHRSSGTHSHIEDVVFRGHA
jgi:hypothetical protein